MKKSCIYKLIEELKKVRLDRDQVDNEVGRLVKIVNIQSNQHIICYKIGVKQRVMAHSL